MNTMLTRRMFVGSSVAAAGLAAAGCTAEKREAAGSEAPNGAARAGGNAAPAMQLVAMTVYRDPSCGCCEAWAGIARNAGYQVELIDHPDMAAIKRQHGVPDELLSCHTTIVDGYAIEGHVPLGDLGRLLRDRPAGVKGLAVPGMPRGSPGMEMPDGSKDRFQVLAFDAAGRTSVFNAA